MQDYIKETIAFYEENLEEYIKNTDKLQDKLWLRKFAGLLPKKPLCLIWVAAMGEILNFL